ncbi:ATP-dependent Clp protease ATP-binding subunit [Agrococcus sediminis]|uniref:ATP-dependent Clp protease ATP-binding subunit n=1 Tax=Agrococcus sediminis TaxID=2599924 RepID=A0A5M8QJY6_9MICO|nr:AAA family ATPase [Agrococcus sediminis]KAA6436405.1 ATP-dependent Clp protease ATP-binding subunit [Agrococcus sediminis]
MSPKTAITIYYGPAPWFADEVKMQAGESFLEAVRSDEDQRNRIRTEEVQVPEYERLIVESGDYASIAEHAITNFPSHVQRLHPGRLLLHNPPTQIDRHLKRVFRGKSTPTTIRHEYPTVTSATLRAFEDAFEKRMVGQAHVKQAMLGAMYPLTRKSRSAPVVVMFYGPSGVGKTETAKLINGLLGGDLMRRQFSMYHSERFGSYVFGGSHHEQSLANDLLVRESGVILLDEFDKAHSTFHSAFYELFDEGVYEDRNYRVIVGPALIICTSNYASEDEVHRALGDALYSRFDALIGFKALGPAEVATVIEGLVEQVFGHLDPDEVVLLDRDGISQRLQAVASREPNIRRLRSITEQYIYRTLAAASLATDESDKSGSDT